MKPSLYLQISGELPDNKLDIIDALISDITADYYYDDLACPCFYIDTKNLIQTQINQIKKIGASFGFEIIE